MLLTDHLSLSILEMVSATFPWNSHGFVIVQNHTISANVIHLAFVTDEYEKLHEQHKKQNVICYENEAMGIYFISDPDGYWIEIVPAK